MVQQFTNVTLPMLPSVAEKIASQISEPVILINGPMGAGKTTFVKALCKAMQISDAVSSPTFSLVNEYLKPNGNAVFHFDFYRIQSEEEAQDFGVEEYLESGEICLLEWSENIRSLLPQKVGIVTISGTDACRTIQFEAEANL